MGNPSCPMCREVFYSFPTAPISTDRFNDNIERGDLFPDPQSWIWSDLATRASEDSISSGSYSDWFEENRVLRVLESLEHNSRVQNQRFMLIEQMSGIREEGEDPPLREIQYHRRPQARQRERPGWYQRDRLEFIRMQQDYLLPDFWALDASIQELIAEETSFIDRGQSSE
ncbi:hypothetical protein GQ44DRAFT_774176 [Phaeosphaeriaceae sp. PMI808]|nr:hypothetical protein GQ44DRAFT_774176 [Phaeosphaeriaceae sp. PMI808]